PQLISSTRSLRSMLIILFVISFAHIQSFCFFFNYPATTEIYTLSLHDALPICQLQRVALARALVIRPRVLLLDEPLSNLDAALRLSIRKEIRKIQQELGMTTVFVTHDQEEAMSISDRVAVMRTAQLVQVDTPMVIYEQPRSAFVANFVGRTTLKQGKVTAADKELTRIDVDGLELLAKTKEEVPVGGHVWVSVRPQHVQYAPESADAGGAAAMNGAAKLQGVVDYLEPLGAVVRGEVCSERGGHFLFEIA